MDNLRSSPLAVLFRCFQRLLKALTNWKANSSYAEPETGGLPPIFHLVSNRSGLALSGGGTLHLPSKHRDRQAKARLAHTAKELHFPASIERSKPKSQYGVYAALAAEMTLAKYAQTVGDEKREAGEKVASLVLLKKENAA